MRNAAAYSAILGLQTRIYNVRANRTQPGLKRQHLIALELLADACGGNLIGGSVGSNDVTFQASFDSCLEVNQKETLVGDTKTAGSICLLLQAVLPYAMCTNRKINWTFRGGTNALMAPQYDYWEHVFLPVLSKMGISIESIQAQVVRRGYFPKGGGEVVVSTTPLSRSIQPILLTDRGQLTDITIRAFHGGKCPKYVAVKMLKAAESYVKSRYVNVPIHTIISYDDSVADSGSGILLVCKTATGCRFGGSALGSRKVPPQETGIEAAKELCSTLEDGGCVDEYLQDQLIIYMALASGTSRVLTGSLTMHTQSAIDIAKKLCNAKFQVRKLDESNSDTRDASGRISGRHLIQCEGIALSK